MEDESAMAGQDTGPSSLSPPASFVVQFWATIFQALRTVSLFWLLRRLIPWFRDSKRSYAVIEGWVLANTVLALGAALYAYTTAAGLLLTALLIYGALRVFEIFVIQVNVLLFDEWRARHEGRAYALRSYRRMLILLLHNFAEVVGWFLAALLTFYHWSWVALDDPSLSATFRATLLSMVAFSTEGVRPLTRFTATVLTAQSLIGVFMTMLTLGRFLSLMPVPATQEPTEK